MAESLHNTTRTASWLPAHAGVQHLSVVFFMHRPWLDSLMEVGRAVERLGGEVRFMNGDGRRYPEPRRPGLAAAFARMMRPKQSPIKFTAGDALEPHQWELVRAEFGGTIPSEVVAVIRELGSQGFFDWYLQGALELPPELADCTRGGIEWYFDDGIAANRGLGGWDFDDPDGRSDQPSYWHTCVGFFHVANGDVWGIDTTPATRGRVLYLDHEGGDSHGTVLGPDIVTVMNNWCRLGCVGPEFWNLAPFLNPNTGIDGFGPAARRFRSLLSLPG